MWNIPKSKNISYQLGELVPSSRDDLVYKIEAILKDCVLKKIDSHNTASVVFIYRDNNTNFLLKAEYGDESATKKEIGWYLRCSQYDFVPNYVSHVIAKSYSLLLLEYIEGAATLDELAHKKGADFAAISKHFYNAITSDQLLFKNSNPKKATYAELDKFYVGKYKRRLQEAAGFPYLLQLLQAKSHVVNGKSYFSPEYYINKINNDSAIRDHLMPDMVGLIHGDLHGGNILISADNLYLVDPNGDLEMPIEYDYGKMLHTVHGGYPDIMDKSYVLETLADGFRFELQIANLRKELYTQFKNYLSDKELARGLYAEAMHFATMLPHHASNRQETTALFLRCIALFDELLYNIQIK